MKKQHVDHVLRAASRITGEKRFIIVGSQALHGKHPDIADDILKSAEVDLVVGKQAARAELLNAIGHLSPFHEKFGYYADVVDLRATTLPKGWKGRLVDLPAGDRQGVKGVCLEPHDLAISKYVDGREKDLIFSRALVRRGLLSRQRLLELLAKTSVDAELRDRVSGNIARDFQLANEPEPESDRDLRVSY